MKDDPPLPERESTSTPRSDSTHPPRHILVLEDDPALRQLNTAVLLRFGYTVDAAEDADGAWVALQSRHYDLLITDNQMPGLSGLELVKKLRSAQMALPVIVASGGVVEEDMTRNPWLQPAAALPKPFTSDMLLSLVSEVLDQAGRAPARSRFPLPEFYESYRHGGINE
jgi:DNA-binding response OmpR family regulator